MVNGVNYKDAYLRLKQKCVNDGYKVEEVCDSKTKDYVGMNNLAATDIGYPKMGKKTLFIDDWLDYKAKYHTLKHELIEHQEMGNGKSYWKAHEVALKREKYGR